MKSEKRQFDPLPEQPIPTQIKPVLIFERGQIDATDLEDQYQQVIVDCVSLHVDTDLLIFYEDMPGLSTCKTVNDLIDKMKSKGWEIQ